MTINRKEKLALIKEIKREKNKFFKRGGKIKHLPSFDFNHKNDGLVIKNLLNTSSSIEHTVDQFLMDRPTLHEALHLLKF